MGNTGSMTTSPADDADRNKRKGSTKRVPSLTLPDLQNLYGSLPPTTTSTAVATPISIPGGRGRGRGEQGAASRVYVQGGSHIPEALIGRIRINDDDDGTIQDHDSIQTPAPTFVRSILPPPIRRVPTNDAPIELTVTWRGGGNHVFLVPELNTTIQEFKLRLPGTDRRAMSLNDDGSHSATIHLTPGTHHLRFLVDDQWLVSDSMPTTVDDEGTFVNYISVGSSASATPAPTTPEDDTPPIIQHPQFNPPGIHSAPPSRILAGGASFWSTSTDDTEDVAYHGPAQLHRARTLGSSSRARTSPTRSRRPPVWTSVIPPGLEIAAKQSEDYLTTLAAVHEGIQAKEQQNLKLYGNKTGKSGPRVVNGFHVTPPEHILPPPPRLPDPPEQPRHLEKLILNVRPNATTVLSGPNTSSGRRNAASSSQKQPESTRSSVDGVSDQRIDITFDSTIIADDSSLLPVPSHSVLGHLTTSAIRGGVLAVGSTIRYRGKVCIKNYV